MAEVLRRSKTAGVTLVLTEDQKLQVLAGDEVLVETKVLSYAEIAFEEAVNERTADLQKKLNEERALQDIRGVRESSMGKAGTVKRRGGWSGR